MVQVNLKSLVGQLNPACRRALEAAAGLCLSRSNYEVEVEHWLVKLLEGTNTDIPLILRHYGLDASRVMAELTRVLDSLKTGNSRPPALSPGLVHLAREAWVVASIEFGAAKARSGHVLYAMLAESPLGQFTRESSPELRKISLDALKAEFATITENSEEVGAALATEAADPSADGSRPTGPTTTPGLDQYTIDLTARARKGEIDPVLGRDAEIRQIVDILTRRRQNNPILTGEAGVGKTAVVEGFAQRIADGDVPPSLENVVVRSLDMALLQAGAGVKGEFENRLKSVINEVKASPKPIILFIDEAHSMIGAGGQAGQGDAANILKPALARGELRTIAATTWAEYKKYFEKDAALARRFQVVKVEEPCEEAAIEMMRGVVDMLETHHGVRVLDEGVVDAVRLSHRYISGRQLPDKSISLLDTACAKVAIGHAATPAPVEDARRRIEQLNVTLGILQREQATGADHQSRIEEITLERIEHERELEELEAAWNSQRELVAQIRTIREKLTADRMARGSQPTAMTTPGTSPAMPSTAGDTLSGDDTAATAAPAEKMWPAASGDVAAEMAPETSPAPQAADSAVATLDEEETTELLSDEELFALREELASLNAQLEEAQGEQPLMQVCVDSQAVAEVVSSWTGIPVGRMVSDEITTVLTLKDQMEEAVVGQSHALDAIAQRVRTSRANLSNPDTPIGVFLLAGPSGVGKTETAITLANLLYGGEQNMTTINMSEFKEEHKVSLLMGSPPGYVGYGEGGVLTEAVRRKPYSVVLLDEMEKAHRGVQDIFYQVFDKGTMKDGEGRDIDFRNTLILMTSNAGSDLIMDRCDNGNTRPDLDSLTGALHAELLNTFKPAFLGRLKIVPYYPLSDDIMRNIAELKLGKIVRRVRENYNAELCWTPELIDHVVSRCTEVDTGARNIDNILTQSLLPDLAGEFLGRMAEGGSITRAEVSVDETGAFRYDIA